MVGQTKTYSTFDAKNKLSELLDLVEKGEEVTITRHGQPVAKLIPFEEADRRAQVREAFAKLREIRESLRAKGVRVTTAEIIEWKNEGRR